MQSAVKPAIDKLLANFPSTQLSKVGLPSHTSPCLWYCNVVDNEEDHEQQQSNTKGIPWNRRDLVKEEDVTPQPSECGRQRTLNSEHTAARLQSNANLAV